MEEKQKKNLLITFSLGILVLLSLFVLKINKLLFFGKAVTTNVTFKILLQGSFTDNSSNSYKTKVTFYTKDGKAKELADQPAVQESSNKFKLQVNINDLDLSQIYAVFIKPDKYIGKIFCSQTITGSDCNTAQIIFQSGDNALDLTSNIFYAGDIAPQQGKVSAYDLSKIIKDFGKTSTTYLESDINSDRIVDSQDYSLALYAIGKNAADDPIAFPQTNINPSSSPTSANNQPTNTPAPGQPTNTPNPGQPTNTPMPTQAQSQAGTCNGVLNGKAYVNTGIFGEQCRIINNEQHHYCVTQQSDCNPNQCISLVKNVIKQILPACSNGIATLDEQKTQVTCQTQFVPGSCSPEPTPSCEDNRQKC